MAQAPHDAVEWYGAAASLPGRCGLSGIAHPLDAPQRNLFPDGPSGAARICRATRTPSIVSGCYPLMASSVGFHCATAYDFEPTASGRFAR